MISNSLTTHTDHLQGYVLSIFFLSLHILLKQKTQLASEQQIDCISKDLFQFEWKIGNM